MALEPDLSDPAALMKVEYHVPDASGVVRDAPGACPICGMALEPRMAALDDAPNPGARRHDAAILARAGARPSVFMLSMADMVRGRQLDAISRHARRRTGSASRSRRPVVVWAGWPFFVRGVASVVNRSPNMFTLIALGVGAAYAYSAVGVCGPSSFRTGSACTASWRPTSIPRSSSGAGASGPGARIRRGSDKLGAQAAARSRAAYGSCAQGRLEKRTCRSSTSASAISPGASRREDAGRRRRPGGPHRDR